MSALAYVKPFAICETMGTRGHLCHSPWDHGHKEASTDTGKYQKYSPVLANSQHHSGVQDNSTHNAQAVLTIETKSGKYDLSRNSYRFT